MFFVEDTLLKLHSGAIQQKKINASHIYNLKILVAILKSFKTPGKINFLTYLTQLYKNIEIL